MPQFGLNLSQHSKGWHLLTLGPQLSHLGTQSFLDSVSGRAWPVVMTHSRFCQQKAKSTLELVDFPFNSSIGFRLIACIESLMDLAHFAPLGHVIGCERSLPIRVHTVNGYAKALRPGMHFGQCLCNFILVTRRKWLHEGDVHHWNILGYLLDFLFDELFPSLVSLPGFFLWDQIPGLWIQEKLPRGFHFLSFGNNFFLLRFHRRRGILLLPRTWPLRHRDSRQQGILYLSAFGDTKVGALFERTTDVYRHHKGGFLTPLSAMWLSRAHGFQADLTVPPVWHVLCLQMLLPSR